MKMYLNESQTAKLIELGFEKPKMAAPALKWVDGEPTFEPQYTIGELIAFCPRVIGKIGQEYATIEISHDTVHWIVGYTDFDDRLTYATSNSELIDAIFGMLIKLKGKDLI